MRLVERYRPENLPTFNCISAREQDGDGEPDGHLHGGRHGDTPVELPMAEERGEHCWSYRRELHDAVNDDVSREQHGGDGDERGGDANGCLRVRNLERECGQRYEKYGPDHLDDRPAIGLTGAVWHECCLRIDNAARLGFSRFAFGAAFLVESRYPLSLSSDVP